MGARAPARIPRIIPAYAGSTCPRGAGPVGVEDHPRIRGEHPLTGSQLVGGGGSSPHTRGARQRCRRRRTIGRIIPAYAGSTADIIIFRSIAADHPRIRGEHCHRLRSLIVGEGSSPHTRGAPASGAGSLQLIGIIPAYAGSTFRHPQGADRRQGSSPHTRGAPAPTGVPESEMRIIPAYAGSTGAWQTRPASLADHPRIRGEHVSGRGDPHKKWGSSPHTRGARAVDRAIQPCHRIIPAYAGSTWGDSMWPS